MKFDANVRFMMNYRNTLPYVVADHIHDCYEIVYYVQGTGTTRVNGVEYDYSDNTLCIIPPHAVHAERATTETELIFIGFEYNNALGELPTGLMSDPQQTVLQAMRIIKDEIHLRDYLYKEALARLQEILIIHILRILNSENSLTKPDGKSDLEYAVNYITSNFIKDIDLEDLARSIGYSYHHFRHMFRLQYGISPKQFIINTRINHAKTLLIDSTISVESIAAMCGFNSSSQFIVTFKGKTGFTPVWFRKNGKRFDEKAKYIEK